MLNFECDYLEGAHPKILQRLMETNLVKQHGYTEDDYCESAKNKIRAACGTPDADIYFLVGGTQTNSTVIASVLKNYEGVIATVTGHISTHESGAIEHSGHKVLTLPHHEGKMDPDELLAYLVNFYGDETYPHMVFPGMVYISQPTEYGTLYSRSELTRIKSICEEYKLPLYIDGARIGYGVVSRETDLTLPDIAGLCDIFYIGGTKVGALCGEAVVFPHHNAPDHFFTTMKQQGAVLAKGRLLGIQFDELFTDNLYFEISKNAVDLALYIKDTVRSKGYDLLIDSPTNQQFIIIPNDKIPELRQYMPIRIWEPVGDDRSAVRFVTSWATTKEDVDELLSHF